jgi:hypothetical protein
LRTAENVPSNVSNSTFKLLISNKLSFIYKNLPDKVG